MGGNTAKSAPAKAHATISIDGRLVGPGHMPYLIAEVAQAHDGSLGFAHAFIDAAAQAGADAVKFQTHFAADESTQDEPFRIKFSKQDATRFDYWKRLEFTEEEWAGLADHAKQKKLTFLSSAFSPRAMDLLERLGMPAWKIASGEVNAPGFLDRLGASGKPVLLSTGMSTYAEVDAAVKTLQAKNAQVAVLQCTSRYPTSYENTGLNVIDEFRRSFGCPVGLSDHSGRIYTAIIAMARGADLVEAHITFDKRMFGPDVSSSLTVEEFAMLNESRRAQAAMDAHPVNKDAMAAELDEMRRLFKKSAAAVRPLAAGTVLTREMLTAKKPGTGIPAQEIEKLIGRRLARAVSPDRILTWSDIDE